MKLVQMKLVYPLVLLLFITKNDRMASATGGIFPPGISIATPDNEAMESSDESGRKNLHVNAEALKFSSLYCNHMDSRSLRFSR